MSKDKKEYTTYRIVKKIKGTDYNIGQVVFSNRDIVKNEDTLYLWFLHDGSNLSNSYKLEAPESLRYYKKYVGDGVKCGETIKLLDGII